VALADDRRANLPKRVTEGVADYSSVDNPVHGATAPNWEHNVRVMAARKWLRRVGITLLSLSALIYVGICGLLMANQHRLVFGKHFPVTPIRESLGLQPQTVQVGTIGSLPLFAVAISSMPADNSFNRWVLYFHGVDDNNTDMWDQTDFHQLRDVGFHVLAPEYPGYSRKPGQSTEKIVDQEAQIAYDYLRKTYNVPESNIVIFGTSLGTGVAVDLASRVRAGALVLNAPCTSGNSTWATGILVHPPVASPI
jgi:uncharacterized protein